MSTASGWVALSVLSSVVFSTLFSLVSRQCNQYTNNRVYRVFKYIKAHSYWHTYTKLHVLLNWTINCFDLAVKNKTTWANDKVTKLKFVHRKSKVTERITVDWVKRESERKDVALRWDNETQVRRQVAQRGNGRTCKYTRGIRALCCDWHTRTDTSKRPERAAEVKWIDTNIFALVSF